jgi:hypothetical protein
MTNAPGLLPTGRAGVIEKTESEYDNAVVRLLVRMRLEGRIPWSWITDGTRWMHKSVRYGSVEEAGHKRLRPPLLRAQRGRHVDPARVAVLEAAEASERELLGGLPAMVRRGAA